MVQPSNRRLVTEAEEQVNDAADRAYVDEAIATALAGFTPGGSSSTGPNVRWLPEWNGTGTQPTRPAGTTGLVLIWPQPIAPPIGANYASSTDRWENTAEGSA